jgi:hypothetical protein
MKTFFLAALDANALGAAVGGFLGVTVFFGVKWLVSWIASRPKVVKVYDGWTPPNNGAGKEVQGLLMHHHGAPIEEKGKRLWFCSAVPCNTGVMS